MDDLVKRARDVLDGATSAPWVTVWDGPTWGWLEVKGPSFSIDAPTRATDLSLADEMQRKADARFIAASRDLVPAMADRIEAQAAEIARLTAKKDALLRASSTARMAFAGYVSAQTAINELDAALGNAQ